MKAIRSSRCVLKVVSKMVNDEEANPLLSTTTNSLDTDTGPRREHYVQVALKTFPSVARKPILDRNVPTADRAALLRSTLASLSYGGASLAMVFLNKAVLLQYPCSVTLLFLQQVAAATIIQGGSLFGLLQIQPFSLRTAKSLLPLSLFYNGNVAFALSSLKDVNIPMYIAIKRLTPLGVLVAGCCRGKTRPSLQISLSVVLIAVGVMVAALGDFSFDPLGYGMALASVFFQTAYLLLVERSGAEDGLSSTELMLYNAVLSLPFMVIFIFASNEYKIALPLLVNKMESTTFAVEAVLSLVMGMILNLTMFWCTIVNSALTTTIVGVMKGVVSMVLGFFVLGGVDFYILNVTGLMLNTIGGVWYSFAKYRQRMLKRAVDVETKPRRNQAVVALPPSTHPAVV